VNCRGCISAEFHIAEDPAPDQDIAVQVDVVGTCTHTSVPPECNNSEESFRRG